MKTIIVIPTYNEAENITPLIEELLKYPVKILVVDDNSPDKTWQLVAKIAEQEPRVNLIKRDWERGRGLAGKAGFISALAMGADYVIEMDADFSHHPKFIPDLIEGLKENDIVIGSRLIPGGEDQGRPWRRRAITKLANWYLKKMLGLKVQDGNSGFRAFRREVLEKIDLSSLKAKGPAIVQEVLFRISENNFKIKEIPITFTERQSGQSKLGLKHLYRGYFTIFYLKWQQFKNRFWRLPYLNRAKPLLTKPEFWAIIFTILFAVIFSLLSFGRHLALKSYGNDLGQINQLLWNTAHNHIFQINSPINGQQVSYLIGHFSLILIFFLPFYYLFPGPEFLLIAQVLAIVLGAIPFYRLAKLKINHPWAGLAFLTAYLLFPVIHNALLYDFHEIVLTVPLLLWAFYFITKQKNWLAFLFFILTLTVQEHAAFIVAPIGLYLLSNKKTRKLGLAIFLIAVSYFCLVMFVLMPKISGGAQGLLTPGLGFNDRYQWLGASVSEIIKNTITQPQLVFQALNTLPRWEYLIILILPLFTFSLYSPLILTALPVIIIYLLSSQSLTYRITFYHSALIAPIIFLAAINGFSRLVKEKKYQSFFLWAIVFSSLAMAALFGLTPLNKNYRWQDYWPNAHARLLTEVKKQIPPTARLSAQHNLLPHFSGRENIYRFPINSHGAEYVLIDLYNPYQNQIKPVFGFAYALQLKGQEWLDFIQMMFNDKNYGVSYYRDGYLIFKKGQSQELNNGAVQELKKLMEN